MNLQNLNAKGNWAFWVSGKPEAELQLRNALLLPLPPWIQMWPNRYCIQLENQKGSGWYLHVFPISLCLFFMSGNIKFMKKKDWDIARNYLICCETLLYTISPFFHQGLWGPREATLTWAASASNLCGYLISAKFLDPWLSKSGNKSSLTGPFQPIYSKSEIIQKAVT